MANSLYITGIGPGSGKSLVSLGVMEMLSRRVRKINFFRPVVSMVPDNNIQLIHKRYRLECEQDEMYAIASNDAQSLVSEKSYEKLIKKIVAKYQALEYKSDFILCEGTDFSGASSALEFEFNAEVANNLGSPILLMVNGRQQPVKQVVRAVEIAYQSFIAKGCSIAAIIVNRVPLEKQSELKNRFTDIDVISAPIYLLPEVPVLGNPTVKEISTALSAKILQGEKSGFYRTVTDLKVAAMNFPHFLDHISDGDLIITPADRADVILACMASTVSDTSPNPSGLLLTGDKPPDPKVMHLIQGLKKSISVPVAFVKTDTFTAAMDASKVPSRLTPGNDRKIAAALGCFESYMDLKAFEKRLDVVRSTRITPIMFEYKLIGKAKSARRHIVLPEGDDERVLQAVEILLQRDIVDITLLGDPQKINATIGLLGLDIQDIEIINPMTSNLRQSFAGTFYELRKDKGISEEMALDTVSHVNYFGTLMVHTGMADGMVSGATHTTGDTIRPAFQIVGTPKETPLVSSVFFMCLPDRVLVYGDCAVNPNPNAEQLAGIAISSARTAQMFGIEPKVAMCSYSTGTSGKGQDVDKVRQATEIVRESVPELKIEGPIQYDAAIDAGVAKTKLPRSDVAGKATVFIFPDLNTGNNLYKAVQRSANAVAIGPVLQGLNKPVNDLSRGCTIADIVNTVVITAIQAQKMQIQTQNH